ncbi:MAG: hypothetical protein AUK47_17135 [Deltaproteobacteria bacterium CG2_30_63_29]|nr:MAG: hypothetical protein AUK47_17135 [Deltaproteobacteria bacterium CG2_30_63_29]PJB36354.1 MAG: hypothetical protein CO108_23595 [Deltaproteobacteria bacterium CG_4_9_14_3_um_filter_63_12]
MGNRRPHSYVSFDMRGAHTTFGFGSFDPKGTLRWAKTYGASEGDKRNANAIAVMGGIVYVGGRTAELEDKMGDGVVVGVSPQDGSPVSSLQYFGGKGPNELAEHRVKGFALDGAHLIVGMQVYTANSNPAHYWGQWFEGTGAVANFSDGPVVKAIPGVLSEIGADAGGGAVVDVAAPLSADWSDAAALKFQDPHDKADGVPPDADVMVSVIEL